MASDDLKKIKRQLSSEFSDWHILGGTLKLGDPAWPVFTEFEDELSVAQKEIVERNVELLSVRTNWELKVARFTELVEGIADTEEKAKTLRSYQIRFDQFTFENAVFYDRVFPCTTSFSGATFQRGPVHFGDFTFKSDISFNGAKFIEVSVFFHGIKVQSGRFFFNHVHVKKKSVSFFAAKFLGEIADFSFLDMVDASLSFNEVRVQGHLFFNNVKLSKGATFRRLSVDGTANYAKSTFDQVPDFTDSKFDRPPDVSGMEVLAFKGWNVWKLWVCPFWNVKNDEGAKFRKLKAMALAANDHEKNGEFFAYEMLAKRGHEQGNTGPIALFLNWLYFTFSNFGQSYLRPAIALGLNFLVFFMINALTAASYLKPSDLSSFAFWQSLKNMIPFLNSLIRFASRPDKYVSTYETAFNQLQIKHAPVEFLINAGLIQNFIGLVLLFLLLLGLRNKFRLK